MSEEQINIAIAEALGHKDIALRAIAEGTGMDSEVLCSGTLGRGGYAIPNYCNDLNAMHGAEETLDLQKAGVFAEQLRVTVYRTTRLTHVDSGSFAHVHTTARQRAEAFLKTIGKWEGAE
jgi:hypothetical protein